MNLLYGMLFLALGHLGAFFQLNGQFKWDWFKTNEWAVAGFGVILSFFYIWGTKYAVEGMNGMLWPVRFIGFGIGIIIYAGMVSYFFNEGITTKTIISLALAIILICIQVLWK